MNPTILFLHPRTFETLRRFYLYGQRIAAERRWIDPDPPTWRWPVFCPVPQDWQADRLLVDG